MNTKLQLLVIVIVAIFSISSSLSLVVHFGSEKNGKGDNSYLDNRSADNGQSQNQNEHGNANIPMIPISHAVPGFNGTNTDDDGITHHFHFERVRRARRCAGIFCCIAKIILILSHAALLICGYFHVLHH